MALDFDPSPRAAFPPAPSQWADGILDLFCVPFPDSAPLLTANRSLVESVLRELSPASALPVLLAFQEYASVGSSSASASLLARKFVALSHSAADALESDPAGFVARLLEAVGALKAHFFKTPATSEIAAALSHGFESLVPHLGSIQAHDCDFRLLSAAQELSYLIVGPANAGIELFSRYFSFFLRAFELFPIPELEESPHWVAFTRLIAVVKSMVVGPIGQGFDLRRLSGRLLAVIGSPDTPLEIRNQFFTLLLVVLNKLQASKVKEIVDASQISLVVPLLIDHLKAVPFQVAHTSKKNAATEIQAESVVSLDVPPVSRRFTDEPNESFVQGFIQPSFPEEVPLTSEEDRLIKPVGFEIPLWIADIEKLQLLLSEIGHFCRAIDLHGRLQIHIDLLGRLLEDPSIRRLDIFPYFLGLWIGQILKKDATTATVDSLSKLGCFTVLLEECFLTDANSELIDFALSLYVEILKNFGSKMLIADLLRFFIRVVRLMPIPLTLSSCVRMCGLVSPLVFIHAANEVQFFEKFAIVMLRLQKMLSNDSTRSFFLVSFRQGLYFMDLLRSHIDLLKFAFGKVEFALLVMSLLYDSSTALIASTQITQILMNLQARGPIMQFIFKFLLRNLFVSGLIPERTLTLVIETVAAAFRENSNELGIAFSETQFLESLIALCVEIHAVGSLEALVILLSHCLANAGAYHIDTNLFLSIEPLVNGSVVDCLLEVSFKDSLRMTVPRAIRTAAPLSSLFHIFRHNDEQLTSFISFVGNCVEAETTSQYELLSSDFPAQLLRYMATFRISTPTPVFDTVLQFFVVLSRYSLKPEDLLSYFQLFSTLPGNFRPRFTDKLLEGLSLIIDHVVDRPSAFFMLDGIDGAITLPRIPADALVDGFSLVILLELLAFPADRGFLIDFHGAFSLFIGSDKSMFSGAQQVPYVFQLNTWTHILVSYNKRGLTLIMDGKEVLTDVNAHFGKEDFSDNLIGHQLRCNIAFV
jgi:hypothetical protein